MEMYSFFLVLVELYGEAGNPAADGALDYPLQYPCNLGDCWVINSSPLRKPKKPQVRPLDWNDYSYFRPAAETDFSRKKSKQKSPSEHTFKCLHECLRN